MRYRLHSIIWIFLVFAVIGMLAFDIPMAEAQTRTLRLELSSIDDIYAVPGSEVPVDLTINAGSFTNADEVDAIEITIDYKSSVANIEGTVKDRIAVYADRFGIEIAEGKWTVNSSVTDSPKGGDFKRLKTIMTNWEWGTGHLQEPASFPAVLMTITFTVKTFDVESSTDLEFIDDNETFFTKRDLTKLLLDGTINGKISFIDTPSTKVTLSLPSLVVYPPKIGDEIMVDLTVVGGYIYEDLIDAIKITIAYDSTIVAISNDPPKINQDIILHLDRFGITSGWSNILDIRDALRPPEHPELDKQLQISIWNSNPTTYPALGKLDNPEALLTIKFIVQSENPEDKTLLFFVDSDHSSFGKRDTPKRLPVDPIHGEIALPVKLSALGAIWNPNGTKIFWEAESQQGNLGWNIYRSEAKDGKFVKINGELIKGAGTTSNPMKYSFIDKDAEKGKVYYYYLEDISFNGEKHRTGIIKSIPVNKITSWGDIKRSALR